MRNLSNKSAASISFIGKRNMAANTFSDEIAGTVYDCDIGGLLVVTSGHDVRIEPLQARREPQVEKNEDGDKGELE